jgi:predicted CoA-binding protein
MPTTRADIFAFLAHHRIAVVGVSRDLKHFSRYMFDELCTRGYDAVPVNPQAQEVAGHPCFARVSLIKPPVQAALLMTPPVETEKVVRDCKNAGIREVWIHQGAGQGSVSRAAAEFCREHGLNVIEGQCPFMFLPHTQFVHRAHGFLLRLTGRYPAAC